MNINEPGISPLGAVMSFLYSAYIVLNAVLSSVLGTVIDADFRANGNIYNALTRVGGIQFSVCAAIIFASTFIPRGAFAFNPKQEGDLKTPDDEGLVGEDGSGQAVMGVDDLPKAALTGVAQKGRYNIDGELENGHGGEAGQRHGTVNDKREGGKVEGDNYGREEQRL